MSPAATSSSARTRNFVLAMFCELANKFGNDFWEKIRYQNIPKIFAKKKNKEFFAA